eukprot:1183614-Prorocentrum_minimum.AAC.2
MVNVSPRPPDPVAGILCSPPPITITSPALTGTQQTPSKHPFDVPQGLPTVLVPVRLLSTGARV